LAVEIYKLENKDKLVTIVLIGASCTLLYLGLCRVFPGSISPFEVAQRYFYIPFILVIWVIAFIWYKCGRFCVGPVFWLGLVCLSAFSSYSSPPLVDLKWKETVLDPQRSEIIPINPPPWQLRLPLEK
jgi:hypothetical protein